MTSASRASARAARALAQIAGDVAHDGIELGQRDAETVCHGALFSNISGHVAQKCEPVAETDALAFAAR